MVRVPGAFFYGFTGIINHRVLTNQIARSISIILLEIRKSQDLAKDFGGTASKAEKKICTS